ncbi:MAG TPA: alpha/beta fold hydrolase [Myxococcales bacterium]|jgi:pimeloyl-ACP methyl ester carboxylesterase|nr:alpha/beta fold hydrolase [Myxococcales bacterium]
MEPKKTIVLIHGLWLTALSWERWVTRYRQLGYEVVARSWPGMEGDIEDLRRDPHAIEHVGLLEVVDHYEKIIRDLGTSTIIIGHSFGGVVTQILLDRGLGSAGVALDSAPVKGSLVLPVSSLRSAFPALKSPGNRHRAVALTAEEFHYSFTNTLSDDESAKVYARYAVPGPGRVLWQSALANFNPHAATKVDFHNNARAPLLLIAGGADHVSPPAVTKSNAKLQEKSVAITAYKEFPGRSHYTFGQPGWEDVADFALSWALHPTEL